VKGEIVLSHKEAHRVKVMEQVVSGRVTLIEAIRYLQVSYRHAKRLKKRYVVEGVAGLAHKNRGRKPRNAVPASCREKVIRLYEEKYRDFNDTHFTEKLKEHEGMLLSRETVRLILRRHGVPLSIYHDRHSSLVRIDDYWSLEEQLQGSQYPTHVGRVLEELGITAIPAYSPQAKGRIERRFGVLQDRMITDMRLAGITDMDTANKWLKEPYIDIHNAMFAKPAPQKRDIFPLLKQNRNSPATEQVSAAGIQVKYRNRVQTR